MAYAMEAGLRIIPLRIFEVVVSPVWQSGRIRIVLIGRLPRREWNLKDMLKRALLGVFLANHAQSSET